MLVYIMGFTIAAIFARLAGKINEEYNKKTIIIFSILSILTLAVIGGARDVSLGTDVKVYVISHFDYAHGFNNIFGFLTTFNTHTGREPLYRTIVFLVSRFTNDVHWLLFTFQVIIVSLVYIGAYKHRKVAPIELTLLIWCFLYYNDSYNVVRQHLAMAVIFSGIDYLENRKYFKFCIFIALATMLHTSGALAFLLLVIKFFLDKSDEYSDVNKKLYLRINSLSFRKGILYVIISVCCLFVKQIAAVAVALGLIHSRYMSYFNKASVSGNTIDLLIYGLVLIAVIMMGKINSNAKKNIPEIEFYQINAFSVFMFYNLARVVFYGNRLTMYFGIVNILLIAQLPKIGKTTQGKTMISAAIVAIGALYWWYVYVHGGVSMTYPYVWGI